MDKKTAFDVISSGSVTTDTCLSSVFEIEHVLLKVQELNDKLTHLQGLKKYRVESADIEIKAIKEQIDQYRGLIQTTMLELEPNQKVLQFPSIGKCQRRKSPDSWKIEKQDEFLAFLESRGMKDKVLKKVKETVDLREAKKVLDALEKEGVSIPGVSKEEGSDSLSVTFEKSQKVSKITTMPGKKSSETSLKPEPKQELNELEV